MLKQPNQRISPLPPLSIFHIRTIFVSGWKEACKPHVSSGLFLAGGEKPSKFWLSGPCPWQEPSILHTGPCSPAALPHQNKAWPEAASHLLSFSRRSPFSWAHESLRDIFKDLPGARDQRLGTFAACELVPVVFIKKKKEIMVCPVQQTWLMAGSENST